MVKTNDSTRRLTREAANVTVAPGETGVYIAHRLARKPRSGERGDEMDADPYENESTNHARTPRTDWIAKCANGGGGGDKAERQIV